MTKKDSLHKRVEQMEKQLKEQKAVIIALNKKLQKQDSIPDSCYFRDIHSFEHLTDRLTNDTPNVWFVTLNYDPQFIKYETIDEYYDFYERIVYLALEGSHPICHGTYEFTKQGQLHLHFLIQIYDINELAGRLKPQLTHRPYLNYSMKIVKPSPLKKFINDEGEFDVGVDGIYNYMSKTNNKKFQLKNY